MQGKLGISSLAAVVKDLCLRSGLSEAQIDAGRLQGYVEGYIIHQPQTYRRSLEALQAAYFFDAVESDGAVRFVPRGGASVADIDAEEIIYDVEDKSALTLVRAQEVELPKRISVVYLNRAQNYQTAMQYAQRQVTESDEQLVLDLPIVCDDQLAKQIAETTLLASWIGRVAVSFSLPLKYLALEPTDILTLQDGQAMYCVRVVNTRMLGIGVLRVDAVIDDSLVYATSRSAQPRAAQLSEVIVLPGTGLELLDIPALPGDVLDLGCVRVAAAGKGAGWSGAALYRSDDNGGQYGRVLDLTVPATIGVVTAALPSGAVGVFDEVNQLTVALMGQGQMQSVSDLAVLNGANAAMVGDELIQFRQAELLEPGLYRLSGLLRGRLGTEWAMSEHVAGERFVLLDGAVSKLVMPNQFLGMAKLYKPVSFGERLADVAAYEFFYEGRAFKPYSPVHVQGVRDGSGNLALSWVRRARAGGDWRDGVDVPLHEFREVYEVDILNLGTVLRTITDVLSPGLTYSALEQTEDFGAVQSAVNVAVYQVSAMVGRGYPALAAV